MVFPLTWTVNCEAPTTVAQVAAKADHHWVVRKTTLAETGTGPGADPGVTQIDVLDVETRQEEVARMLAGATVTDEARAAAQKLLALGERQHGR